MKNSVVIVASRVALQYSLGSNDGMFRRIEAQSASNILRHILGSHWEGRCISTGWLPHISSNANGGVCPNE